MFRSTSHRIIASQIRNSLDVPSRSHPCRCIVYMALSRTSSHVVAVSRRSRHTYICAGLSTGRVIEKLQRGLRCFVGRTCRNSPPLIGFTGQFSSVMECELCVYYTRCKRTGAVEEVIVQGLTYTARKAARAETRMTYP